MLPMTSKPSPNPAGRAAHDPRAKRPAAPIRRIEIAKLRLNARTTGTLKTA
jgi:hypothetical protein